MLSQREASRWNPRYQVHSTFQQVQDANSATFVLRVQEGLAFAGVRTGSLLCETFTCGFVLCGKCWQSGKERGSSAGKVRGGWILFTWGTSLFLIPLERVVCLGQDSTDFWKGWGGQEVITGFIWKLGAQDNFRHFLKNVSEGPETFAAETIPPFEICLLCHTWSWTPSSEV